MEYIFVRFYFIFYNNLEIDFQNYLVTLHSIEVTVQDTKIIDVYLQPLLRKQNYKMDYNLYLWTPFCYSRWHHKELFFWGDIF